MTAYDQRRIHGLPTPVNPTPSVQTALVTDEHHLAVEISLPHLPGTPTVCISQDEAAALADELLTHADADPEDVLGADHGDRLIDSWKDL